MALTLRLVKGAALTYPELDGNFLYLSSSLTAGIAAGLITASVSSNTITFTKGDGSTFPITVNTGSGGGVLPTLQQVTTVGNITTDSIISPAFIVDGITTNFSIEEDGAGSNRLALKVSGSSTFASTKLENISKINYGRKLYKYPS